ncbi:MAG: hypothetical protein WC007_00700 [Pelobacteraceae bacterium]
MTCDSGHDSILDVTMALILLAIVVGMVAIVELKYPYFFLQDDNRVNLLPYYVHNTRAVLGGEFPLYNFHQSLGIPVNIQYSALYPAVYIATMMSSLMFGHDFATIDILAFMHLVMASLGFYALMRSFVLGKAACLAGAISWVLCAFVFSVGNSSLQTLEHGAYFPWVVYVSLRLMRTMDMRQFVALAFLKVFAMTLGNPQLFIYTVTFELLAVLLVWWSLGSRVAGSDVYCGNMFGHRVPLRRLLMVYGLNQLCIIILALPLLVPTFRQVAMSAERNSALTWQNYSSYGYDLHLWINGLVAPFHKIFPVTYADLDFVSHIGYLTLLFLIVVIATIRDNKQWRIIAVLLLLAVFSLLWSCNSPVTRLFFELPLFNRLRYPFRLNLFTSFFLIMAATFGAEQLYISISKIVRDSLRMKVVWGIMLAVHLANFGLLYTVEPPHVFSRHLDTPPFNEPLRSSLGTGKIVSAARDVVWDGEKVLPGFTAPLLGYNYATLYGVYHFGGFDTLLSEKSLAATIGLRNRAAFDVAPGASLDIGSDVPLEYFRSWGVKWYFFEKSIPLENPAGLRLVLSDAYRNVLYDPVAKPFAYWRENGDDAGIACTIRTNAIEITSKRESKGNLIVTVLNHPLFSALLDGEALKISEAETGQLSLGIPAGNHTITVRYADPYVVYGAIASLGMMIILSLIWIRQVKTCRIIRKDDSDIFIKGEM